MNSQPEDHTPLLGEAAWELEVFLGVEQLLQELARKAQQVGENEKRQLVNQALFDLIHNAPNETFLLSHVMDFIQRVRLTGLLPLYSLADFETWLNHSGTTGDSNERIRGKIVGKYLPREDYQAYFPVGLGKRHHGSHYVTAHNPPDLDTAVASFWGWMDAFGARVGKGLHWWNLPGEEVGAPITRLFEQLFGSSLLEILPLKSAELKVTAYDLMRQKGFECCSGSTPTSAIQHGQDERLFILVNTGGYYEGCWRAEDVENLRLSHFVLRHTWASFEGRLRDGLLRLFAQPVLTRAEIAAALEANSKTPFSELEAVKELATSQQELLAVLLFKVLGLEAGLDCTFAALIDRLCQRGIGGFVELKSALENLLSPSLFNQKGELEVDRSDLLKHLAEIQEVLSSALEAFRTYFDRLDVAIEIKHQVFGLSKAAVRHTASLEEVKDLLGAHTCLPVIEEISTGEWIPVGVVYASDIHKKSLGTVTLRDFCNREEVKIPSYLDIISVVDHHRSSLITSAAATAVIGDAQSCNVLLAELAFELNDRYGSGGIRAETLAASVASSPFLAKRLAERRLAAETRGPYYVHPKREFVEYLAFLYAILDDTDLLSRVTTRDVRCVASLLNRLKSLLIGSEVEIINLDDIPRGPSFARLAARRILQNRDMYSLYSRIYAQREREVELDLASCVQGNPSTVFADTKEQKGCALVGQTKIFPNNFSWFVEYRPQFLRQWLDRAHKTHRLRPEIELYIQMITTIAGAEEVFKGNTISYSHSDELWLWVPSTDTAYTRLSGYLSGFCSAPEVAPLDLHVHLLGPGAEALRPIFVETVKNAKVQLLEELVVPHHVAVVQFAPAVITSRKLSITPHIPSLDAP